MKEKRVRNWSEYNKSLVGRGNISLWINESCFDQSCLPSNEGRGRRYQYADGLILAALTLKSLYSLPFRALEGFLDYLFKVGHFPGKAPNYTTLARRQKTLANYPISLSPSHGEAITLVVDSTGLKICGEGEWCVKKHGKRYQRTWRKVHVAVDPDNLQIVSCEVTPSREEDFVVLPRLLESINNPIDRVIGDGAYDTFGCYESVYRRGGKGLFPPRAGARLSTETPYHKKAASPGAISQRDEIVAAVRRDGKQAWKEGSGYHKRSLAETTMYRLKRLLGERIAAKIPEYQALEVKIRCGILNKMAALSQPGAVTT